MRYIRLNNDVKIKWEILRNTDPEVFTNKDITVKLFSKCGCEQPISYTIVDNKIFIDYFGKDQRETGSYRLCLIENDGKKNMATLDYVDCFTLSKTLKNQTSTGSDSSSSLKTEVIELSSKINTTGVEYVGGDGIDVVGSVISVDETVARTDKLTELEAKVDTKADKTELPDVSIYNPTDNFKTINGNSIIGTGDVVIEVPNNLSQLNNDMDYITRSETVDINTYNQHVENQSVENTNFSNNITELQNNKADKTEIPDVSIYNPTNNFKTINGQSIIGTGNIEIQGGGGGSEDKMDKHHPIFTETFSETGINPNFRLHGYITYSDYNGTFNDNCVERYRSKEEMYIRWDLQAVQNYLNANTDTKYAAVKGFCRADSSSFGNCKYLLFIENTETGTSEQIDQYLLDTHVYGAIGESNNITGSSMAVADSRDPNDIISAIISNSIGNTTAYYIRNGVTYNCPYQMYQCDTAFNTNMSIPYMTTLIDIKGIINNYNISDYNRLTVKIVTEDTTHWHIMSSNLFFTNDTDFIIGGETTKDYVLIDELNKKAEKDKLKTINGQSIIGTGNIEIQGGSGDITANGDNTFNGTNTFFNPVFIYNPLYYTDPRDSNYTNEIFNVLTESHTSQLSTYNNMDSVYESGKKFVWSEEQNKAIIVEDANYNIKYCNSVYTNINYVYNVTNGYEAFWWNGQYAENGVDKIIKKVELNTSPSNEYVHEFYVNVSVDYTEDVNVYYYIEAQFQSYLEGSGFIKDAPFDGNQYVRQNGSWALVQGGSSAVTSVNGHTGDVVIDIPTNVSQLNNDAGYLTEHQDLSNYATKTELSEYNKTNNFKTINNQSIIGTGNIEIQGGGGGEDKMNKHHPIFNETYAVDEIKPEFRLSGYIDKIETQGTTNYNCVERWHSVDNLWVRWSLENINTYLTNNPNTKYAAVKGFCLPSSAHLGECEYHLFIENTSTGLSEQIDQYMQDRHVYGDYIESKNITLNDSAIVDSRDPNDNIIGALNQAIGSTTTTCRFIRNGVTYYTPDSMSTTNLFFNDNYTLPYMTSIIDIKGILEHYSLDTYTSLRVQMKTTHLTHWHIMSCYLFFSNDAEFMKHSETSVDYVLIDELTQKATKNDLNDYNKTNNFKTINNQSIIGTGNIEIQSSSAVTSVNGATGDVVIEVPTNVSQLNNDAGYLTEHQDLSNYATTEFVNTATNNGNIVWTGTQAEYDALSDKTVYLIYLIKK